jgi:hypothetical protein
MLISPTLHFLELMFYFHKVIIIIFHSSSSTCEVKTSLIPEDFPMRKLALQPGITITPLVIVLNQTIHPSMILGLIN